jgi:hypothetical protein
MIATAPSVTVAVGGTSVAVALGSMVGDGVGVGTLVWVGDDGVVAVDVAVGGVVAVIAAIPVGLEAIVATCSVAVRVASSTGADVLMASVGAVSEPPQAVSKPRVPVRTQRQTTSNPIFVRRPAT